MTGDVRSKTKQGDDGITHRPNTGHLTLGVDTFAIEVSVSSGNNGDRSG